MFFYGFCNDVYFMVMLCGIVGVMFLFYYSDLDVFNEE